MKISKILEVETVWAPEDFRIGQYLFGIILLCGIIGALFVAFAGIIVNKNFSPRLNMFGLGMLISALIPIFVNSYFAKRRG